MMKEFKSKVGYEILIPVLIVLIGSIIWPIVVGVPTGIVTTVVTIVLPIIIFTLHMFYGTTYRINERNELLIKCGLLFHSRVDISKIRSIGQTRSLISSPAPSMDRIELKYGKFDSVIISPKDKIRFVNELLRINPNINCKIEQDAFSNS